MRSKQQLGIKQQMPHLLSQSNRLARSKSSNVPDPGCPYPPNSSRDPVLAGPARALFEPFAKNKKLPVGQKITARVSHLERRLRREALVTKFSSDKKKQTPVGNQYVGRAAELLVCFDFLCRGYEALAYDFPGSATDVLAVVDGQFLRIQVKGTAGPILQVRRNRVRLKHKKTEHLQTRLRYQFTLKGKTSYAVIDLFAFVALDSKSVLYVGSKGEKFLSAEKKAFGAPTFAERAEGSLDRFLAERFLL